MNISKKLADFAMSLAYKYRLPSILIIVGLTALSFLGMQALYMDSSNESFLGKGDPVIAQNQEFKEVFGNEEFVFIMVDCKDSFSPQALTYLRKLGSEIQAKVPFVKEVLGIHNVEYADYKDDTLVVENLVPDQIPSDPATLDSYRKKLQSKKLYDGLMSKDSRYAGLYISFKKIPTYVYVPVPKGYSPLEQAGSSNAIIILADKVFETPDQGKNLSELADPRKLITPALSYVLEQEKNKDFPSTMIGVAILDFETDRIVSSEMGLFGLLSLIFSGLTLLVLFRKLRAFIIPILVAGITLSMLLGLMGFLKFPINITSILIPTLILVISVSYSIHFISHFLTQFKLTGKRKDSIRYMLESTAFPCFLAGLTTAIGFLSFLFVPIQPLREIGIISSLGVFITFLLAYLLTPLLFSFGKDELVADIALVPKPRLLEQWSHGLIEFVIRYPVRVIIAVSACSLILLFGIVNIKVQGDMLKMLGNKFKVVQDIEEVTSKLGALYSYEIMISLPELDMAKDPTVLKAMDELAERVSQAPQVFKTISLADMVKDLRFTMNGQEAAYNSLPETREEAAQYLLLYEMSGGDSLSDMVDFDYTKTHISVQLKALMDNSTMAASIEDIQAFSKEHFPQGTEIAVVGDMALLLRMIETIISGQISSVLLTFVIIGLIMMVALRSPALGMVLMIPNVIPVFIVVGIMGFCDIKLDLLTMLISSIIIGIAVDNTIHFSVNYRNFYHQTLDVDEAIRLSAKKTHAPFLISTIVLCIGFGMLGFSKMSSLANFSLLSVIAIITALVNDFVVTPALLKVLKPYKEKKNRLM